MGRFSLQVARPSVPTHGDRAQKFTNHSLQQRTARRLLPSCAKIYKQIYSPIMVENNNKQKERKNRKKKLHK